MIACKRQASFSDGTKHQPHQHIFRAPSSQASQTMGIIEDNLQSLLQEDERLLKRVENCHLGSFDVEKSGLSKVEEQTCSVARDVANALEGRISRKQLFQWASKVWLWDTPSASFCLDKLAKGRGNKKAAHVILSAAQKSSPASAPQDTNITPRRSSGPPRYAPSEREEEEQQDERSSTTRVCFSPPSRPRRPRKRRAGLVTGSC